MPPRPSSRTSLYFPSCPPSWRLSGAVTGSTGVETAGMRPLDDAGDGLRDDEPGDGFRDEEPGDGFREDEPGSGGLVGATGIVAVSIAGAGDESPPCSCIRPVSWSLVR